MKRKRKTVTKVRTAKNPDVSAQVLALYLEGKSQRTIARETGHSKATINQILRIAHHNGKVETARERVLEAAADSLVDDIEFCNRMRDDIEAEIKAPPSGLTGKERAEFILRQVEAKAANMRELAKFKQAAWIGTGIFADKTQTQNQITVNVATGSTVQVLTEYREKLKKLPSNRHANMLENENKSHANTHSEPPKNGGGGVQK